MASFFRPESHPDLWGNHSLHHPFPHLGQCSKNEDHHTFIFLQLNNYNSILKTKYDSIWMPPVVYRDMQWIKSDMYERIMNDGFATNTMSTTWSCKQYDNDEACHNKRNSGKLHGNISPNGYGNALIGRYGGCFEEGIWWVYGTGESCAVLERLAMVEGWECV